MYPSRTVEHEEATIGRAVERVLKKLERNTAVWENISGAEALYLLKEELMKTRERQNDDNEEE